MSSHGQSGRRATAVPLTAAVAGNTSSTRPGHADGNGERTPAGPAQTQPPQHCGDRRAAPDPFDDHGGRQHRSQDRRTPPAGRVDRARTEQDAAEHREAGEETENGSGRPDGRRRGQTPRGVVTTVDAFAIRCSIAAIALPPAGRPRLRSASRVRVAAGWVAAHHPGGRPPGWPVGTPVTVVTRGGEPGTLAGLRRIGQERHVGASSGPVDRREAGDPAGSPGCGAAGAPARPAARQRAARG